MNSRSLRSAAEFAIGAILPRIQKISGFCVRRDTQVDCLLWEWHFHAMRFIETVAFGWNCTVCVCGSSRKCTRRRPGKRSRNFGAAAENSPEFTTWKPISSKSAAFQQRTSDKHCTPIPPLWTLHNLEVNLKRTLKSVSSEGKRRRVLATYDPSSAWGAKK